MTPPSPALRGMTFQPTRVVARTDVLSAPIFSVTSNGACTENTVQVIAPGENPSCPNGRIVFQTGGCMGMDSTTLSPSAVLVRDLIDNKGALNDKAPFTASPFPAVADGNPRCCDNLLLKLEGGVLLAIRQGTTWAPVTPQPAWWSKVRIDDSNIGGLRPHGAPVAQFVYRSNDCGTTWVQTSVIDPISPDIEEGKWAVPRPNEDDCQTGHCYFGGWDRPS